MCLVLFIVMCNCQHFAADHFHIQLSSLHNWQSSKVYPVDNISSVSINATSAVLWSSTNFCCISQHIHYKAPVAAQHWKTNKVVWTCKDDWPQEKFYLRRPFTWEGNYLVFFFITSLLLLWGDIIVSKKGVVLEGGSI